MPRLINRYSDQAFQQFQCLGAIGRIAQLDFGPPGTFQYGLVVAEGTEPVLAAVTTHTTGADATARLWPAASLSEADASPETGATDTLTRNIFR